MVEVIGADTRPAMCRNRLRDEGKPHPKSGCQAAGCGGVIALDPPLCERKPKPTREHHHVEQVKRHITTAIVEYGNTKGMAVASRRAADKIIHLLLPNEPHRDMVESINE